MKTIVFQSYRRDDVPAWIARSMETVKGWARPHGYEYRFIGDEIFDLLPSWFRSAYSGRMLLLTDLARLKAARRFLDEGYTRAVWIDADVVIFDPEAFTVENEFGFALCREVWVEKRWGTWIADNRINNCVSVYERGNSFLDFYLYAAEALAKAKANALTDWDIGTNLLSTLGRTIPLPLIGNVGMFTPLVVNALAKQDTDTLAAYAKAHATRLAAGNLCGSSIGRIDTFGTAPHEIFEKAVESLIASGGQVLTCHLRPEVLLLPRR